MGTLCAHHWIPNHWEYFMSGIQIVTEPAQEPLSLQEVKDYLRVEDNTDERTIRPLIETARRWCEEHTGRTLVQTTYKQFIDSVRDEIPLMEGLTDGPDLEYYKNYIVLSKSPILSVTHVKTFNDADTETVFASSKYYLDNVREPGRIVLRNGETFPTALRVANAIEIQYVAGYSSVSQIPEPLKVGMLQHIAFMYEQRGDMGDYLNARTFPPMVKGLYSPYVIHSGMGSCNLLSIG